MRLLHVHLASLLFAVSLLSTSLAGAQQPTPTKKAAKVSPQEELARRLDDRFTALETLVQTLHLKVLEQRAEERTKLVAQNDALAAELSKATMQMRTIDKRLKAIEAEVDKPLISELWFGFVSDRFNATLSSALGMESEPSTPLWTAGLLSLALLLLKTLTFFLKHARPDSALANALGKFLNAVVVLYLVMLTGSLLMLASQAPGSAVDTYQTQLDASTKLSAEMSRLTSDLNGVRADLATRTIAVAAGGSPAADTKAQQILRNTDAIKAETLALRTEVTALHNEQDGPMWTLLVTLASLCILAFAFVFLAEHWSDLLRGLRRLR